MATIPKRPLTQEEIESAARLKSAWEKYQKKHPGTTQDWLGQETGLGKQSIIGQYLTAKIQLNLKSLLAICGVIGVDPTKISPSLTRNMKGGGISETPKIEIKLTPDQIEWLALMQDLAPHDVAEFTEQIHARQVKNRAIFESLGSRVTPRIPMETTDFSGHAPSQKKEKSE